MEWIHHLVETFHALLAWLAGWVIDVITATGGWGVFILMALESANIPIPSEVIMPFAGFVASQGELNLWWISVLGGLGNTAGSWLSYEIGRRGGRPFVERYGRYFLVRPADLEMGDRYFQR
ncbi:MAG: DedA family protein, partial [Gemmatimonadota bacterium]